ncbi:tyrosine-type recombinase/integrase, partial [Planctomycetota bacterium]
MARDPKGKFKGRKRKKAPPGLSLRDGLWYMDIYGPYGKRYRQSLRTRDLELAKVILAKEHERVLREAHNLVEHDLSVEAVMLAYEGRARSRMTEDYWQQSKRRINEFLSFAKITRIDQVRPAHILTWQQDRLQNRRTAAGKRVKRSTVVHDVKCVRTMLNWATRFYGLKSNPADQVERLAPDYRRRRIDFLTPHERDDLLQLCQEPVPCHGRGGKGRGRTRKRVTPLYPITGTALYAGLRLGEILYLDWPDIDFERAEIAIHEKPGFQPKTREDRVVPLMPQLAEILRS